MTHQTCATCGIPVAAGANCPACGTPAPAASGKVTVGPWEAIREKLAGAVAPRYEVRRMLAYGGMAGVYLADEPRLGRQVAIKVMAPGLMLDPSLVDRFEQEARTIAQFSHPNIITIYEVDQRADLHYFVMSYVPGRTLGQVMAESTEPLSADVVRAWLYQIGDALAYAHEHGVIHRDVKPGNVLLDARGNAVVSDFGIAKVADAEAGFTRTGMLVGTPAYMSPEQCGAGRVTEASDQYALGAVVYQMLTGQPPFSGPTLSVLQAQVGLPAPPIERFRPDCPPELIETVKRMLEKRPADRWPTLAAAISAAGARAPGLDDPLRDELQDLATVATAVRVPDWRENLSEGTVTKIAAEVLGGHEQVMAGRRVRWRSSDPVVVTVLGDELFASHPGKAQVRGTCGPASVELGVTVVSDPIRRLEIALPETRVAAGNRVQASAAAYGGDDSALAGRAVLWSSTDPDIARVRADGVVHTLAPGETIITASTGGCSAAIEIEVTSNPASPGTLASVDAGGAFLTPIITGERVEPQLHPEVRTPAGGMRPSGIRVEARARPATPGAEAAAVAAGQTPAAGQTLPGGIGSRRPRRNLLLVGGGVIATALVAVVVALAARPRDDTPPVNLITLPPPLVMPNTAANAGEPGDTVPIAAAPDAGANQPGTAGTPDANPPAGAVAPDATPPATATVAAPGAAAAPAAPATGTIEVVGSLPDGTVISVQGADGQTRQATGRSIALTPGNYDVLFSRAGWEISPRTVRLRAGDTVRVTPIARQLAPEPSPATVAPTPAPAPPPAAADMSALRAEALSRVQELVAAMARRDTATVLPLISQDRRAGWRTMLADRSVTDFQAAAESTEVTSVTEPEVMVQLRLHLSFRSSNVLQQSTTTYRARLTPGPDGLRVVELTLVR